MQAAGHWRAAFCRYRGCSERRHRGVVVGKGNACVPTVFHLECPQDVQDMVCTQENPNGPITNSDLELAGLLICWLVMEEVSLSQTRETILW